MNLFNFVVCFVLMSNIRGGISSRVLMFERLTVEHKVLEGSPVSLRCVSRKMESVRIFQRFVSQEGKEVEILLVSDLAFSGDHHSLLFSYNYTWSTNEGFHDLTIDTVDRSFSRHLFVCVTSQTFTPYKLRILDVFYHPAPPLEFNVVGDDIPVFFTEEIGDNFEIYCTTETGKPQADVTISNSHFNLSNRNGLQTSRNTTHSTSHFSALLENSWNNSYFYCHITQSFPSNTNIQDYVISRSYGPLLFYDQLHVEGPVQAQHFKIGDFVNFTCASNINFAKAEWTERMIPGQISVLERSVGPALSLYIENITSKENVWIITASCKVSLKGRHAFKTFVAYSTEKAESEPEARNELENEELVVDTEEEEVMDKEEEVMYKGEEVGQVVGRSELNHKRDFGRTLIVAICGFLFLNFLSLLSVFLVKRKCQGGRRRESFDLMVKRKVIGEPSESMISDKDPEGISDDPVKVYSKHVYPSGLCDEEREKYCSVKNDFCRYSPPEQRFGGVTLYAEATDPRECRKSCGSSSFAKHEEKYGRTIMSGLYVDDYRFGRLGDYSTHVHPDASTKRSVVEYTKNINTFPEDGKHVPPSIIETDSTIYSEIR